jgi:signal transduction histidine kinase
MLALNKFSFANSISNRLLKVVLSIYFVLTFFVTSVHIYIEYNSAKENIKQELLISELTFSDILASDLWNYDLQQLEVTVKSIVQSPSVIGVSIEDMQGKVLYSMGDKVTETLPISRRFGYEYPLKYKYKGESKDEVNNIGKVKLISDTNVIFDRIKVSIYTLLINAVIKTIALVFLVTIFFNRLLTRPLGKLAFDAEHIDFGNIQNQKIHVESKQGDELSVLEVALNKMIEKISSTISALNDLNKKLEDKVKERTTKLNNVIEQLDEEQIALKNEAIIREQSENALKTSLVELKLARGQLIEAEKMASLGALVAGVAHEINTPVGLSLTGISHFEYTVNNLEKQFLEGELEEDEFKEFLGNSKELAKTIHISLNRAASLVKSFKQVAVDQSHDELRDFDIIDYLSETMLSLSNKLKQSSVKFEQTHNDSMIIINSYPGCWAQIFTNLIQNTLIHAYNHGDQGHVSLTLSQADDKLNFVFQDNGKGMDEITRSKIFDPFFTTNREGGGSGLGLNIIYNIITQQMHGTIKVNSEVGKGTTFTIQTPLNLKNQIT